MYIMDMMINTELAQKKTDDGSYIGKLLVIYIPALQCSRKLCQVERVRMENKGGKDVCYAHAVAVKYWKTRERESGRFRILDMCVSRLYVTLYMYK